jgi:hypothetical protein
LIILRVDRDLQGEPAVVPRTELSWSHFLKITAALQPPMPAELDRAAAMGTERAVFVT